MVLYLTSLNFLSFLVFCLQKLTSAWHQQEIAMAQHRAAALKRRAHLNYNVQTDKCMHPGEEEEEEEGEGDELDEADTWDAPLQHLRVNPISQADSLLWVGSLSLSLFLSLCLSQSLSLSLSLSSLCVSVCVCVCVGVCVCCVWCVCVGVCVCVCVVVVVVGL